MKKLLKIIGLFSFIVFSFFYTDKVLQVVREEDDIMIQIESVKDSLEIKPINAKVISNTIIPGVNGRSVNVSRSYKVMKSIGVFSKKDIVYDVIRPDISMYEERDKYVVLGNQSKKMVSLIFILNDNKYLDRIERIVESKDVYVNYFVSYDYLVSNTTKIKELSGHEFYSYGDDGNYTPDNLLFSNNLISRISENDANLCLTVSDNKNLLELCSKNNLYTIVPNIVGVNNAYDMVKSSLSNGSMILLSIDQDMVLELPVIIDYIKGKGFEIVGLSHLISEEVE